VFNIRSTNTKFYKLQSIENTLAAVIINTRSRTWRKEMSSRPRTCPRELWDCYTHVKPRRTYFLELQTTSRRWLLHRRHYAVVKPRVLLLPTCLYLKVPASGHNILSTLPVIIHNTVLKHNSKKYRALHWTENVILQDILRAILHFIIIRWLALYNPDDFSLRDTSFGMKKTFQILFILTKANRHIFQIWPLATWQKAIAIFKN